VSTRLEELQPWLYPYAHELVGYAAQRGVQVTSVRRSYSEQWRLYVAYLRGESRYPAAPPGHSMHERGRAWDMVGPREVLAWAGDIWQSWGGTWHLEDDIHFEA
jgi:hypothetical protein